VLKVRSSAFSSPLFSPLPGEAARDVGKVAEELRVLYFRHTGEPLAHTDFASGCESDHADRFRSAGAAS
ncbi:MAG: hypothetical protein WA609_18265, partial [Terriglobales bacterium]